MFEGFINRRIDTGQATINCRVGGAGPPVLLVHGYPQTHAMWSGVAPLLADRFTVICPDLRGYGDSSKPPADEDDANYTFRAMAEDQIALMRKLGFDRFALAGHDRGGRVAYRLALDHPQTVTRLAFLDIVPTLTMYSLTDQRFATVFWLWFFLPLPKPFPERLIGADPDYFFETLLGRYGGSSLDAFDPAALADYRRCWRDPDMIKATCADYRAGATRDLVHDAADQNNPINCPTLALWAADGLMGKHFDFAGIWGERCPDLTLGTVSGGHFFADHAPAETAQRLRDFFVAGPASK